MHTFIKNILHLQDNSVTDADLNEMKRKLRPVKSAESLTSGQSEPATGEADVLGPLHCLTKPPGHNRLVQHGIYTVQRTHVCLVIPCIVTGPYHTIRISTICKLQQTIL